MRFEVHKRVIVTRAETLGELFRADYLPLHRPEHMKMLLDSLRKAGLGN